MQFGQVVSEVLLMKLGYNTCNTRTLKKLWLAFLGDIGSSFLYWKKGQAKLDAQTLQALPPLSPERPAAAWPATEIQTLVDMSKNYSQLLFFWLKSRTNKQDA